MQLLTTRPLKTARLVLLIAGFMMMGSTASALGQPTITDLDVLSGGGSTYAYGEAVSADGIVVTGSSSSTAGQRAFRWTSAGGIQTLGILAGGSYSIGAALSADGTVATGISGSPTNNHRAFRWTVGTGIQSIGVLASGAASNGNAISANGSVIVGGSYTNGFNSPRAFRWTSVGGMQNLGVFPGGTASGANAVSADGTVVAGYGNLPSGESHAFRWTSTGGMVDLGVLPDTDESIAQAVSADGLVVVGHSMDALNNTAHAFRWVLGSGMHDLSVLDGGDFAQAHDVNADGSVVVGTSNSVDGDRAILWTSNLGMIDLNAHLVFLGLDLTGWTLTSARGVSADGTRITGYGDHNGLARAWLVTIPQACTIGDVNQDGLINGHDVQTYARLKVSGSGTSAELCAANMTISAFVTLLLSQ